MPLHSMSAIRVLCKIMFLWHFLVDFLIHLSVVFLLYYLFWNLLDSACYHSAPTLAEILVPEHYEQGGLAVPTKNEVLSEVRDYFCWHVSCKQTELHFNILISIACSLQFHPHTLVVSICVFSAILHLNPR